ncbi:MBL fold metallo-hydrolase [Gilvimarinus agarilyticus]|uniref:MBL fold metallo-hydrolase n=1 Tax=unclassified Gilvimarinus TaxID=2642066 RepID=UPI001C08AF12|nr:MULTISPECIES: MBL fold metallo-hydrolase [unclassified Gilvimarinus]MBU2885022.1 MBL fold metallo-hydrolase [Gilvimarinus agarilyticus]MDO6569919.1 MBL fold metallo-hydrolase [Gilvimarinus sp. 2_MG-2023]MDO6747128.1 MBL fold metallo-hydrolase [Gilvimarinus sp. 1_MG-2023]
MRFASLGSGSQGNGTVIEWSHGALLLDCGFSMKEAEIRLAKLGCHPSDLTALVVTHEHSDHIKGVAALARRYKTPVYMTPGTYHSRDLGSIPHLHLIEAYREFTLAGLKIEPVPVPHDAREPAQFIFHANDICLGVLTDLGSISPHVEERYRNCDALLLEANHDPVMLASGPYPPSLKRRVGGAWGHLSNQQTAGFLQRVNTEKLQALVIAHISQKNNSLAAAQAALSPVTENVKQVCYACQDEGFSWIELTSGHALQ